MPEPDPEHERGSPGGYVAGVTKNRLDVVEDELFNGDQHREVPALEIIFYRDSSLFGPGRQIFQFAAVQAVTTYGISCVPPLAYSEAAADCAEDQVVPFDQETIAVGPPSGGVGDSQGQVVEDAPEDPTPGPSGSGPGEVLKAMLMRTFGEGILLTLLWLTLGAPFVLAVRGVHLAKARRT